VSGLVIDELGVRFAKRNGGVYRPIRSCSLTVAPGEIVGLVGESGCGKSLTALASIGLLPAGAEASGRIRVDGRDVLGAAERDLAALRGRRVALIFQNPMSALNPFFTIGEQIGAVIASHFDLDRQAIRAKVHQALERVQLPVAVAAKFPHQMSGGQLQRAMIGMAVACEPAVLIADEPTTALDVTVQARIMHLLRELTGDGMGLLLITHDLALVSQSAERVYVMYAGRVVESGPTADVFLRPAHPYTAGLLNTQPVLGRGRARLATIEGRVPAADAEVAGCRFRDRCSSANQRCTQLAPQLAIAPERVDGHNAECHYSVDPPRLEVT
jgi:peptide/nickel transport system ATP-binding protein